MFSNGFGKGRFKLNGTRYPAYAGSWYEADRNILTNQLNSFLSQASPLIDEVSSSLLTRYNAQIEKPVLAIVVPHAGYVFSGQTAAYSYKAVAGQDIKRVFLLGPSHHVGFHGIALPEDATFATPIGDLAVDMQLVSELKDYPLFAPRANVHDVEHSLEMQLPFIRHVFPQAKIVPLVVGTLSSESEIQLVAKIFKRYIQNGDLLVVSSDFTHYGPRYGYNPFRMDITKNIQKLDSEAYRHLCSLDLPEFISFQERTKDTICGFYPLSLLIELLPKDSQTTLLRYWTSQKTACEDNENSVSYLAIAFSNDSWESEPAKEQSAKDHITLTHSDRTTLLKLARWTIETFVRKGTVPSIDEFEPTITEPMQQVLGTFVTLHKDLSSPKTIFSSAIDPTMSRARELRGCIGHIWPVKPIYQAVMENAISACSRDYRFTCVREEELDDIHIEISVLTPPQRISSYTDIVLGRDGIILFKEGYQSVFLPCVPIDFGWDLRQTLEQLSHKAGLDPSSWQSGANFDVFQTVVFGERDHLND